MLHKPCALIITMQHAVRGDGTSCQIAEGSLNIITREDSDRQWPDLPTRKTVCDQLIQLIQLQA